MNAIHALALIATLTPHPQEPAKLSYLPAVGDQALFQMELETQVQGLAVLIQSKMLFKTESITDGVVTDALTLSDVKVDVGGTDPGVPAVEGKLKYTAEGRIPKQLGGGFQGTDEPRMLAIVHFLPPTKPVGKGDSYTVEVKMADSELGAYAFEGKYEGEVELEGEKLHKVTANIKSSIADDFKSVTTFHLSSDGKVQRVSAKFSQMPVPAVGSAIDGTLKLKRLPKNPARL